jgi:hypothetical protein
MNSMMLAIALVNAVARGTEGTVATPSSVR